ncbi:general odorant-binding protein 19d-like [Pectinophora gossypiella]|uniref:general odorant-binding protein 19d-like n=1 Tax=Pectinophora gossypiella TaxID=13191 RepID=UPI00214E69F8|nr:general odorant-binding protein 19d-like [Pectinophora gossypiella]
MLRASVLLCCIYFAALTPYLAYAMTDEQRAKIHAHFEEMGMACMSEAPITPEDIAAFKARKMATGPNAPCFVACVMRKCGVMDDAGMVHQEKALDRAKEVFEDAEEIKNIENYLHSCNHVNSAAVGDGDKGCERAVLALKCMHENAAQFGFDL